MCYERALSILFRFEHSTNQAQYFNVRTFTSKFKAFQSTSSSIANALIIPRTQGNKMTIINHHQLSQVYPQHLVKLTQSFSFSFSRKLQRYIHFKNFCIILFNLISFPMRQFDSFICIGLLGFMKVIIYKLNPITLFLAHYFNYFSSFVFCTFVRLSVSWLFIFLTSGALEEGSTPKFPDFSFLFGCFGDGIRLS